MSLERVKQLLREKESIRLEFKVANNTVPDNLFESICAMLNREGGDILLGVDNSGNVAGVEKGAIKRMVENIVNLSNNPQKLDPPFILFPQVHELNGKEIICIQVPASSMVHKTANAIFDRSNDGDFRMTHAHQIAEIYNRKRTLYTENIVYPYLKFSDFKRELFPKVRNLIRSNSENHPWLSLDNKKLLEVAGLWKKDSQTGNEGYTLAAGLLFGKDLVTTQLIPHYKIDALVRVENVDRYDDRLYIQTNLIEAYDLLMDFVAKHLPDKFYLEGDQRVSVRSKIFREVIANLIVHREYTNGYPCRLIIYHNRVETENANNPHGEGPINPNNFAPFPKNPAIAKFFAQLGRVDELGSGIINVGKYIKAYSGKSKAQFIEGTVFKTIIPIPEMKSLVESEGVNQKSEGVNEGVNTLNIEGINTQLKKELLKTLTNIKKNEGINAIQLAKQFKKGLATVERHLKILKDADYIEFKGASKTGGYYLKSN